MRRVTPKSYPARGEILFEGLDARGVRVDARTGASGDANGKPVTVAGLMGALNAAIEPPQSEAEEELVSAAAG